MLHSIMDDPQDRSAEAYCQHCKAELWGGGAEPDYTGLSAEEADGHADLSIAALAVCADLYDRRTTAITGTIIAENPVVAQILGAHAVNLL